MFSILIGDKVAAKTPRHFGVNVEVQDHYDRCNLWDWLADSGATIIRELHPEKYLRKEPMDPKTVSEIRSKSDFDKWRGNLVAHPEQVPWNQYMFKEKVKWLGVPDGIIGKVKQIGAEPIISMGYYPTMFPEPLMTTWIWDRMPSDDETNWRAAACAYEYYFAFMYHYAREFGVKYFNLHNEPEFIWRQVHYPPEMTDPPQHHVLLGTPEDRTYIRVISIQMAVLSKIARMACEDVRAGLTNDALARELTLSSPAWCCGHEFFWSIANPYLDLCDFHHYSPDHQSFEKVHRRAAIRVGWTQGKKIACTEFGRKGGPVRVSDLLFDITPALEAAGLMMSALSFTKPDDPPCELATFYHFQFPATHRNYKNLVYGDMNVVDWSGRDRELRGRGDEWYPTFEELQLRHPTAAYHMFRMLARCAPENNINESSYAVMDLGASTPNGLYASLRTLAVDTGRDSIVNIQNPATEKAPSVELDLSLFPGRFKFAVVRETSQAKSDEVVLQMRVEDDRIQFDVSPQSLTQIILTPLSLDRISSLRLVEKTFTPGNTEGLALHQTTRLQVFGVIDGKEHDLTQMNLLWASSDPECMPVYQGGLVVCLKSKGDTVTISANTLDKALSVSREIQTENLRNSQTVKQVTQDEL